jgi:hypothetical protein
MIQFERIPGVSFLLDDRDATDQCEFAFEPKPEFEIENLRIAPRALSTKRNTKKIGDHSEMQVILALTNLGIDVSLPFGENHRYDLIADDGMTIARIQVKTGRVRGDVILYKCASTHAHRGGTARAYFGEIDYLAVYCPETGKVYLLPEGELTATSAHLRLAPPKNNMRKTIRWAADYELA